MPRRWTPSLASACLIFLAASSVAADPVRPTTLPECAVYRLADGRQVCGYVVALADGTETLDEWRAVLRADAELVKLRALAELEDRRLAEVAGQVADLKGALDACGRGGDAIRDRNAELTKQLLETDRALQDERVKPRWGSALSWGAVLVVGAVLVGYVAADQL